MTFRSAMLGVSSIALIAVPAAADARSQMRAAGSSTVYPFAKMIAEQVARANPKPGTPIVESTGTGGGMKLFCSGVGARFFRYRQCLAPHQGVGSRIMCRQRRYLDYRDPG